MTDEIRVLIADDDPEVCKVLAKLIAGDRSLRLVGVADNADEAVELAAARRPDVALLDVHMPGGGPRAARGIRARSPGTAIVALSVAQDESSVKEMLAGGAGSFLVKGTSSREILTALRGSVHGGSVLSGPVTSHVVNELAGRLERERDEDRHRREWEERILRLLRGEDGLVIVFQPIVQLATGRIVGVEALSRFQSEPVRPPDLWFAEAALVGMALDLEAATLGAALSALDLLPPGVFLSVNVSPEAIASPRIAQALESNAPDRLVVEVTEHAPVTDYAGLRSAISSLRKRGVGLAIDDAGAGYASLRHILQLTPDLIKLDVSLTRGIETEAPHRALASALVTFAREIEATVTAEGIETAKELAVLRELGVTLGQGYFLGRPGALPETYVVPGIGGPMASTA